ncbi:methyl-accepting chemotaxis protein [Calditerrivibrio sp.]|uniref:methyl-accepting chemotaxis protein n=1 Tax=Calditerrivibrio sp. TaxID=2792612 RepID=UPI003D0FBDE3
MKNKSLKIRTIVLLSSFIVIALSLIILGYLTIKISKTYFSKEIANQLTAQVNLVKNFVEITNKAIEDSSLRVREKAEKDLNRLLSNVLSEIKRKNPKNIDEIRELILSRKIGEKGYFFLLDMNGTLTIHPSSEGKNLKGQPHIDEILNKKDGFIRYTRTTDPAKPIVYASYGYIEKLNSILVATVNENDYIGNELKTTNMIKNEVKNAIKSTKIGSTGYYYVIDSTGTLIIHPKKEGENISNFDFIKEIINKKEGVLRYPWEGKFKVVAFTYYKNLDWIISAGSYEDEFIGPVIKSIKIWFTSVSIAILIVLFLIIRFIFNKYVTRPVDILSAEFKSISEGDLTTSIEYNRNDEMGIIIKNVEEMKYQMNNTLCSVKKSADNIIQSSDSIDLSSKEMSKAINHLTANVSQVELAVHEMSASIQEITNNIGGISREVSSVKDLADKGKNDLKIAVSNVSDLSNSVQKSGENIQKLGDASKEIGSILEVIREIADQTNLLALNAAIEAARAGEFGRGFAVVADEIRKLAERTAKSISEINSMIKNIQKEVDASVRDVNNISKAASESVIIIEKLNSSFNEILSGVVEIADKINSVATAVEEQSSAANEISANISVVSAVSEITEQNRIQSENLRELAQRLLTLVGKFKLKMC